MPRDAKFGLVLGLCLVIAIAVLFFRKDRETGPSGPAPSAVSLNQGSGPPKASSMPFIPKQTHLVHGLQPGK